MMKTKVYIAGPYSSNPRSNTEIALMFTNKLLDHGFIPFCPHLSHFLDQFAPRSWQDWIDFDLEWVKVCDCLYRIPGESKGADIEVDHAKANGIPVFFDIEKLKEYYG